MTPAGFLCTSAFTGLLLLRLPLPPLLLCRVLVTSDLLANAVTLLVLATGIIRLQVANQTDGQGFVYLGPKHTLTHLACAIPVLLCTCVGPLALMLFKAPTYFKHRMTIVAFVRVLRLLLVHLTVSAPNSAAAPTIARIAVARAWESPNTGLVILVAGVAAYYAHHVSANACTHLAMLVCCACMGHTQTTCTWGGLGCTQRACAWQVLCSINPNWQSFNPSGWCV